MVWVGGAHHLVMVFLTTCKGSTLWPEKCQALVLEFYSETDACALLMTSVFFWASPLRFFPHLLTLTAYNKSANQHHATKTD